MSAMRDRLDVGDSQLINSRPYQLTSKLRRVPRHQASAAPGPKQQDGDSCALLVQSLENPGSNERRSREVARFRDTLDARLFLCAEAY